MNISPIYLSYIPRLTYFPRNMIHDNWISATGSPVFDSPVPFDSNEFIWSSKDIFGGNSHLWHHKYSLPSTKVIGVVAWRVTYKVLGIGSAKRSWVDVKKIKSGKISALSSDISEKQSILYKSDWIEEVRIGITISNKYSKEG